MSNWLHFLETPGKLVNDPGYNILRECKLRSNHARIANWLQDDLHKWTWWLKLALTIIPIIIMVKIIDRRRLLPILLFGAIIALIATFLDVLGLSLSLWEYPDLVLPFAPRFCPVNYAGLPIFYMLVYQYYPRWKGFITANVLLSVLMAFVIEPLFIWLNFYDLIAWHIYYSFPIYIVLPILVKWMTDALTAADYSYRESQ